MTVMAKFTIRDRGATPRGMARRLNAHKKICWDSTAVLFHAEMRDKRFTHAHARAAGYAKRSFKYEQRKLKVAGHTYPLVGFNKKKRRTRELVKAARISSTSNGARIAYPGARVFNFRNPKMKANMAIEFTTITQAEADQLAANFDRVLDQRLNSDTTENP